MNEKIKNKRPSLGWVLVPLLILLVGGWFLWQTNQPRSVSTSEGLALISGDTVEQVVLNGGHPAGEPDAHGKLRAPEHRR